MRLVDAMKVHWMPCAISHTGPAKVEAYFMPESTGKSLPHTPRLTPRFCIQPIADPLVSATSEVATMQDSRQMATL